MDVAEAIDTEIDTNTDRQLYEFLACWTQEEDTLALLVMGATTGLSAEQLARFECPMGQDDASAGNKPADDEPNDTWVPSYERLVVG